jgi:hypothetical protein
LEQGSVIIEEMHVAFEKPGNFQKRPKAIYGKFSSLSCKRGFLSA